MMKKKTQIMSNSLLQCNSEYTQNVDETNPIMSDRVISIDGPLLSDKKLTTILYQLHKINSFDYQQALLIKDYIPEPILFYINSPGGCVINGFNIWSQITNMLAEVKTIMVCDASSSAGIIFCGGSTRVVFEESTMLIHKCSVEGLTANEKYLKEKIIEMKKINNNMLKVYIDISLDEYDEKYWLKVLKKEKTLRGKEIFDLGLANVYVTGGKTFIRNNDGIVEESLLIL